MFQRNEDNRKPLAFYRIYLQGTDIVEVIANYMKFVASFLLLFFSFFVAFKLEGIITWSWSLIFLPCFAWYMFFMIVIFVYLIVRTGDSVKIWDTVCCEILDEKLIFL